LTTLWSWLNNNSGAIGIFVASLPFLWGAMEYVRKARSERIQNRFENYHRLIAELVDAPDDRPLRLDRQLAIVFELQNYPEYRQPTLRILEHLRVVGEKDVSKFKNLIAQIDDTVARLTKR
jgi:hypothetical protein